MPDRAARDSRRGPRLRARFVLSLLLALIAALAFVDWRDAPGRLGESHWIEHAQAWLLAGAVVVLAASLPGHRLEPATLLRAGMLLVWLTALLREVDIDAWGDGAGWIALEWLLRGAGVGAWAAWLLRVLESLRGVALPAWLRAGWSGQDVAGRTLGLIGLGLFVAGVVLDTRPVREFDAVLARFIEETLELWGAVLVCASAVALSRVRGPASPAAARTGASALPARAA